MQQIVGDELDQLAELVRLMRTGSHSDAIMLVINPIGVCVSGWADTHSLEGVNGKSMRGMCL